MGIFQKLKIKVTVFKSSNFIFLLMEYVVNLIILFYYIFIILLIFFTIN
jgi:hypothetical protein